MTYTRSIVPYKTERGQDLKRQIIHFADIRPCLDTNYLVQGWLGAGSFSVIYGPSNTGKTFVAVDLAAHVASGRPWRGCRIKPGPVVYVAAEGGWGIRNRIAAIREAKPELGNNPEFYLLPTHLDLHEPGDAMALVEAMPTDRPAMLVIDTLARSMGAGDENSARDMAQFVSNIDKLRERTGAHVLVVHHSGKNAEAGARGSSALRAAVDTEIAVTEGQISCAKQRDMENSGRVFFALESVDLGTDTDGDPVTSAIVVPTDAPAKSAKPLTGRDEVASQALSEAIRLHGKVRHANQLPGNRKSVELARWREQCRKNGLTEPKASPDTQRKAFTRAKERLIDRDVIRVWGDFVWTVSDDD